jgi:hypothetical protein
LETWLHLVSPDQVGALIKSAKISALQSVARQNQLDSTNADMSKEIKLNRMNYNL